VGRLDADVRGKGEEGRRDDVERLPLGSAVLVLACVRLRLREAPEERARRDDLDPAVDAEADQRDAAGREPSRDRDERLGDVPGDRELLEPHAAPLKARAGGERPRFH
jgi:hypothetical protein